MITTYYVTPDCDIYRRADWPRGLAGYDDPSPAESLATEPSQWRLVGKTLIDGTIHRLGTSAAHFDVLINQAPLTIGGTYNVLED